MVFCTTCKGRTEHLRKTLPRNLSDNPRAKFVVLDYGDDGALTEFIRWGHLPDIASGRLIYYRYDTAKPFHVSHAKNMAARCGIREGADILVTLDADNYTGENLAGYVAAHLDADFKAPGAFLCPDFAAIKRMPWGPANDLGFAGERPLRGFMGRLAARAQDFTKMGGYDESDEFSTWRGEDMDFIGRIERIGFKMAHIPTKYLGTIPHGSDVRFKEYPDAIKYENDNEMKVIAARTETVVNNGRWGVGTVRRNFGVDPIELDPLPTRIFGIGLHKTGTTSLDAAFKALGLDSFHWGEGEAPLIWHEVLHGSSGRSKILERWYAFSDLPFPLLYKRLDAAYPGSKFILTSRDEGAWIKSVEGLWDYDRNPTRHIWDKYPFTNRIHAELYGQKEFDADMFLQRYRRHNAEVREHFKDRPHDLLVMDTETMNWRSLCEFLGVPIPAVPFPRKNSTKKASEPAPEQPATVMQSYCEPEPCAPLSYPLWKNQTWQLRAEIERLEQEVACSVGRYLSQSDWDYLLARKQQCDRIGGILRKRKGKP